MAPVHVTYVLIELQLDFVFPPCKVNLHGDMLEVLMDALKYSMNGHYIAIALK